MFLNSFYALIESQILYKTERSNHYDIGSISESLVSVYACLYSYYRIYYGGAKRSRTVDLLRARQALYQLSYGPVIMVGLGRLELPTPALSTRCSNQLSYRPVSACKGKALIINTS